MARFNKGDKVLINGALVAEILTYDENNDRIAYVSNVGGGTDTTYGHISQTRVEHLVTGPVGQAAPVEDADLASVSGDVAPADQVGEGSSSPATDVITTAGSL